MFNKLRKVQCFKVIQKGASFGGPLMFFHCQCSQFVQVVYDQSLDKVEFPADVVAEVQQSWQAFLAHAASQEAVAWYWDVLEISLAFGDILVPETSNTDLPFWRVWWNPPTWGFIQRFWVLGIQ